MMRNALILILLGLLLSLFVVGASLMPLLAESALKNILVVHRYGPMVVYYSGNVSAMLFDESYFNYSYRNVYVYITNDYDIGGMDHIEEFYNDISKYFPVNIMGLLCSPWVQMINA